MSLVSFKNYESLAMESSLTDIEVAGRYAFQAQAEKLILQDITHKLKLQPNDSLLEIGCGPGNLLIPLSFLVKHSCGVDNTAATSRLRARLGAGHDIKLIAGNFLEIELPAAFKFSKILIYSVIQYSADIDTAIAFVTRALSLLAPGGQLLIGDIPNTSKKNRFLSSALGRESSKDWALNTAQSGQHPTSKGVADNALVTTDDEFVMNVLRATRNQGFESYVCQQDKNLPFGYTREDILVFSST